MPAGTGPQERPYHVTLLRDGLNRVNEWRVLVKWGWYVPVLFFFRSLLPMSMTRIASYRDGVSRLPPCGRGRLQHLPSEPSGVATSKRCTAPSLCFSGLRGSNLPSGRAPPWERSALCSTRIAAPPTHGPPVTCRRGRSAYRTRRRGRRALPICTGP